MFLALRPNNEKKKAYTYNVSTPPAERPLTLTQVKNHLKISLLDTSQDDYLYLLIDSAALYFEKYTNRILINTGFTTFRDDFHHCFLELRRSKVQTVDSIEYLKDSVFTLIDPSVYYFTDVNDYSEIFLNENECWPTDIDCVKQAVRIIFVAGFGPDETFIPADIKVGLLNHIANTYSNRGDCGCDDSTLPRRS